MVHWLVQLSNHVMCFCCRLMTFISKSVAIIVYVHVFLLAKKMHPPQLSTCNFFCVHFKFLCKYWCLNPTFFNAISQNSMHNKIRGQKHSYSHISRWSNAHHLSLEISLILHPCCSYTAWVVIAQKHKEKISGSRLKAKPTTFIK